MRLLRHLIVIPVPLSFKFNSHPPPSPIFLAPNSRTVIQLLGKKCSPSLFPFFSFHLFSSVVKTKYSDASQTNFPLQGRWCHISEFHLLHFKRHIYITWCTNTQFCSKLQSLAQLQQWPKYYTRKHVSNSFRLTINWLHWLHYITLHNLGCIKA